MPRASSVSLGKYRRVGSASRVTYQKPGRGRFGPGSRIVLEPAAIRTLRFDSVIGFLRRPQPYLAGGPCQTCFKYDAVLVAFRPHSPFELLCFIDPKVKRIRNEALSRPRILSRFFRADYVASSPGDVR